MSRRPATRCVAIVLICLLAAAVRLYDLGAQPLWWDEGISLFFAPRSLLENARATVALQDVSPPVYRRALGLWSTAAGMSPFAARFPSAMAGVLAVALLWAIARRLAGPRAALLAALLMAVSPMQVYYSQEAKGYPAEQAALLGATLLWAWLVLPGTGGRAAMSGRRRTAGWLGYALAMAAALGMHYTAVFLAATHRAWTLARGPVLAPRGPGGKGRLNPEWLRMSLSHVAAGALAGMPLLPWLWLTSAGSTSGLEMTSSPHEGVQTLAPLEYLARFWAEFAAGPPGAERPAAAAAAALVLAALCAAGALLLALRTRRQPAWRLPAWVLVSWALLPLALGFVFQLRFAFFFPRFLLYVTPALFVLAGCALEVAWQRRSALGALALLLLLAASAAGLAPIYTTPLLHGEDWRPLLAQVRPYVRSGDAVIYTYMWVEGYFRGYLPGVEPDYVLGFYSPESVDRELGALAARHSRVWLVNYQTTADDPANLAAHWLNTHAARVQVFRADAGEIALYAWPSGAAAGGERTALFGTPGDARIELRYTPQAVPEGESAPVYRLAWRALAPVSADLRVYLHVLAPDGRLLSGADGIPLNGLAPTPTWQPGREVVELRGVLLPADVPPGYRITLGLYAAGGARLPLDGDPAGEITLTK